MRSRYTLPLNSGAVLELGRKTLVVGVLNVTPDSFSDGGEHHDPSRAIERAFQMEADGADIIEIGGESTRPGSEPVPVDEELARVLPVLTGLKGRLGVPLAIDTYKSDVAAVALDHGVSILNDVSALRLDPRLADAAARGDAALVLMHMRGEPATMQKIDPSPDIFGEIERDLREASLKAGSAGVASNRIVIDPGIGFGKTLEQNLSILNNLDRFSDLGFPIMVGTSRKSFIGRLTDRAETERAWGTAASVALAIARGAHLVRVHDVREMVDVARVADAVLSAA